MTTMRFEKLVVKSAEKPSRLLNIIALSIFGNILGQSKIKTRSSIYDFESAGENEYVLTRKDRAKEEQQDLENDEDAIKPIKIMIGLKMLGAQVKVHGMWSDRFCNEEFFKKTLTPDIMLSDANKSLHFDTCLTLADMDEISSLLCEETRPASELVKDHKFREKFPAIDAKWGMYGFMRHRSGVEVRTTWSDTHHIESYGFEAPFPGDVLLDSWLKKKGIRPEDDYDLKFRYPKWKLSKILNRVPQKHKQRVYEWVTNITWDVEEFHDTRGGKYIPETFECEYDNSIITADRNLNFDLIEC